jgi:hypothetical protein
VASDGLTVASDSQACISNERVDLTTQKIKYVDGHVFGFTGDKGFFDAAIEWFLASPGKPDPEKAPRVVGDCNWSLLVFKANRIIRYSNAIPYGEVFEYPQAFGSGSAYALTALDLGKSPAEAVAAAKKRDVYTAGPVQVFDLVKKVWVDGVEALGQLREAAE